MYDGSDLRMDGWRFVASTADRIYVDGKEMDTGHGAWLTDFSVEHMVLKIILGELDEIEEEHTIVPPFPYYGYREEDF